MPVVVDDEPPVLVSPGTVVGLLTAVVVSAVWTMLPEESGAPLVSLKNDDSVWPSVVGVVVVVSFMLVESIGT